MKGTQQGLQGQQKQPENAQYTGSMRQRLNIDNPLLKDISLVYLGLKKVKPKNIPISQRLGSAMNWQVTKR